MCAASLATIARNEALRVDQRDARARRGRGEALLGHGACHQVRDAGRRRSRTEKDKPLLVQGTAGDSRRRIETGERHGSRALNVVVEGAGAVAIARQQVDGVVGGEILELQHRRRKHLGDRSDELVYQRVILDAPEPPLREADIERIVAKFGVLGAHIEHHGEGAAGVDARTRGVERQLADGNAHPVGTEIAEAEDTLTIRNHDDGDFLHRGPVAEESTDATPVAGAQVHAARPAKDVGEALACFPHRGRIQDRQHLGHVIHHRAVEQVLVPILQRGERYVPVEVGTRAADALEDARHLLLLRGDAWRQEAMKPEPGAFTVGERGPLVQRGVVEVLELGSGQVTHMVTEMLGVGGDGNIGAMSAGSPNVQDPFMRQGAGSTP